MINTISGKALLVDIGTEAIKIVEANNSSGVITISKTGIINDIEEAVSEHGINSMSNLAEIVASSAKKLGVTAKRVFITSSILGIKSTQQTYEVGAIYEGIDTLKTEFATRQIYGELVESDISKLHVVESVATVATMKAIVEEFGIRGYSVVSIEGTMTTTLNLMKLQKQTFDFPGKIIIDFGNKTIIYGCNKDTPIFDRVFDYRLCNMIDSIAENIDVPEQEMNELFAKVGILDNPQNREVVINHGIEPNSYFGCVREFCRQYLEALRDYVDGEVYSFRLGRCFIIVTGGFADVPGMYDFIEEKLNSSTMIVVRSAIARNYESDYLKIQNKAHDTHDIGCQFGNCIGLLLKMLYKETANLYPAKYLSNTPDPTVNIISSLLKLITGAVFAVALVFLGINVINYISVTIPQDEATLAAEQSELNIKELALKKQIEISNIVDKTSVKLISFIESYLDINLRVISVDSEDILAQEEEEENADSAQVLVTSAPADAVTGQTDGQSEATVVPTEETKEENVPITYIIRGYATNSDAVSKFYSKLYESGISSQVYMFGVEKATLPDGETMNVFEIHVVSDAGLL